MNFLGNPSHLVREATRVGGRPGSLRQEDRHEQRGSRAHPRQDALLRGTGRMVHQQQQCYLLLSCYISISLKCMESLIRG